jgi:hypothetical protein
MPITARLFFFPEKFRKRGGAICLAASRETLRDGRWSEDRVPPSGPDLVDEPRGPRGGRERPMIEAVIGGGRALCKARLHRAFIPDQRASYQPVSISHGRSKRR